MSVSFIDPLLSERLALRVRPDGFPTMRQKWRALSFLHWAMDPDLLSPGLPDGLRIDTYDGAAYVTLAPFIVPELRLTSVPIFPPLAFVETNVRTYVVDRLGRPGVWFYSLDASSTLAVSSARAMFGLNYFHAEMSVDAHQDRVCYKSKRDDGLCECDLEVRYDGAESLAVPGSLPFFLIERYLVFSQKREDLLASQVHHSPYHLRSGQVTRCHETLTRSASLTCPDLEPTFQYCNGVDVDVFSFQKVAAQS